VALNPQDIEFYAEQLVGARVRHRLIPAPTEHLGSVEEAYRIQDTVANALGPVAGWKVGAKSPSALPTCAPLVSASIISESKCPIVVGTDHIGIELEIAYRLARSFLPRSTIPGDAEILGSITSAHIAIELCRSRFIDGPLAPLLWLLADNQMNHLLVVGAQIHNWRNIDCKRPVARLSINGELVDMNPGGHPAKSPFQLLAWLVRHAVARRGGLSAGSIVTTGSWTGLRWIKPAALIEGEFCGVAAIAAELKANDDHVPRKDSASASRWLQLQTRVQQALLEERGYSDAPCSYSALSSSTGSVLTFRSPGSIPSPSRQPSRQSPRTSSACSTCSPGVRWSAWRSSRSASCPISPP
jgi:2-keto-4-pentenoate hydratase